jgi:glutamate-1-semialdehyde 2,1-aminomutase
MFEHQTRSHQIFAAAQSVIPGGVNSPVRAFRSVGGEPVAISRGKGSRLWDVDGNEYIDYIASWGPLILGHAPDAVVQAVCDAAGQGTSFGAITEREVQFAELLCSAVPCLEMVRLVNSGTEAVMSAIRLARAATGRDLIIKFEGGYHGHSDGLLAKAGSGIATQGIPGTPGVPEAFAALTITIPFNDLDALRAVLQARGDEVACLIGEPVPANMGVVPPQPGYWQEAQRLLKDAGALLIFDEVITGFRLGWSGGQGWTGITPDLCTLGKIIGGGLPVGAYGGRADLMRMMAPEGPVYQAGTLSGNPLAVAGGMAMLKALLQQSPYEMLDWRTTMLTEGLTQAARDAGVPVTINRVGSMLTVFFTDESVVDFASAARSDTKRYAAYFRSSLQHGIMLAPSQFEATFVSAAHSEADIQATCTAARAAFKEASKG